MDIGMLWYDDDRKRSLGEKVARAVDFYKDKYGSLPTVCFINPATLKDKAAPETAGGVQLRSARNVMVDHFWLGVGEAAGGSKAAAKPVRPRAAGRAASGRPSRARATA